MTIDLFRVAMSPDAGAAVARLFAPDTDGRIYVGEGAKVKQFERAFGQLAGAPGVLAVNSCTAALDLALHLCGVHVDLYGIDRRPDDWERPRVISTPVTCTATNGVAVNRDARILWADVDPITGLIAPESVARLWRTHGRGIRAIIAVDWGGRACDYDALRKAAPGIPIIQDSAHRLYLSQPHGDYVAWSHGPIKHLTCGGYGGSLLVPSFHQERARLLRWHGLDRESTADFRCAQTIHEAGYRYHLTDDLATVGLANIDLARRNVVRARENAAYYTHALANLPGVTVPPFDPLSDAWLFTLLVDDRERFMAHMTERGITTSPVHARNDRHPAYTFPSGPLPGVDAFDAHQVSLPVGWWVTDRAREHIAESVAAFAVRQVAYV